MVRERTPIVVLAATLVVFLAAGSFAGATWWVNRSGAAHASAHAATGYTCPMHPNYHSDHPDNCPICGMRLVEANRGRGATGGDDAAARALSHAAVHVSEMIALINRIRRENPALQQNATLTFHETSSDQVLCYSKTAGTNAIVCVVNLDPHNTQSADVNLNYDALELEAGKPFQVHDLLSGTRFTWHSGKNTLTLNPHVIPAYIFRIRRRVRTERDFEYFL